jgi:hypothetical protein
MTVKRCKAVSGRLDGNECLVLHPHFPGVTAMSLLQATMKRIVRMGY